MRVRLKEDPKEWRKSVLLTASGFVLVGTFLHWRKLLSTPYWTTLIMLMAFVAMSACFRPGWYRGFYRLSTRVGFHLNQMLARILLALVFILLLTPLSLILRFAGKDALQLKSRRSSPTYWHPSKQSSPLDRLF